MSIKPPAQKGPNDDDSARQTALFDPDSVRPGRLEGLGTKALDDESATLTSEPEEPQSARIYADGERRRAAQAQNREIIKRIADRIERDAAERAKKP